MPLLSAVLCVRDVRSRAVCSLLLRHQGFRALESDSVQEVVELAVQSGARLVIADLTVDERAALHRELIARLPGVVLLFIHEKQTLERLEQVIRTTVAHPEDQASSN